MRQSLAKRIQRFNWELMTASCDFSNQVPERYGISLVLKKLFKAVIAFDPPCGVLLRLRPRLRGGG